LSEIKGKLQTLSDDVWDVMAKSDTHNSNLFAIYTRLNDIIESINNGGVRTQ